MGVAFVVRSVQLNKQQADALHDAGLVPEPLVAPEPPSAEDLEEERNRSDSRS